MIFAEWSPEEPGGVLALAAAVLVVAAAAVAVAVSRDLRCELAEAAWERSCWL